VAAARQECRNPVVVTVAVTVDRGPSRFGLLLSAAATVTALSALLFVSQSAALVALCGALVLAIGVTVDRLVLRDVGLLVMLCGPIVGGLATEAAAAPLVATVAVFLARDAAENAIGVGEQLGAAARTRRAESVHAAGTLLVGLAGAALGFLAFTAVGGGRPVTTVLVLLAGALLLLLSLRP
jgi:hypothetical protein